MIHLQVNLNDGTNLDANDLADHIRDTDELTLFMEQEVVVHPKSLQWTKAEQSYEIAERDNEEGEDGEGANLPYHETGLLIRNVHPEVKAELDENDYYYQVAEIEWVGKTDYERYVADWMNENRESYKDMITHGCESGMMSDLIYHSQILSHIEDYKRELECIVQEIYDDIGDLGFLFGANNTGDFSFDRLVWMCFEQTVRNTISQLQLNDI